MNKIRQYTYSTIAVLILALSLTIVIQRGCYNRKLRTLSGELNKKDQKAEKRLKEVDSLKTIIAIIKPERVFITTKEIIHQTDTIIKTKLHYLPIESNARIEIDTLGKVDLIYRKWGGCFFPKISMDFLSKGISFGVSARVFYWQRWGVELGMGIYPVLGGKVGIDYRLSKYKYISNCSLSFGGFYNGKWMTYAGVSVFLRH